MVQDDLDRYEYISFSTDPLSLQAQLRPQKTACINLSTAEHISYSELDGLVDQACIWLCATTNPEDRIAVLARNSIDTVILCYAAMRCGRIIQLMNWRMSEAEIAAILADAEPVMLIFDREFQYLINPNEMGHIPATCICRDEPGQPFRSLFQKHSECPAPAPHNETKTPALLLYTSGTTGRPKGVELTKTNIIAGAINFNHSFAVSHQSVLRCDMPMFHIAALGVTSAAIMAGATILISDHFNDVETAQYLATPANDVTHYFAVPQIAIALLRAAKTQGGDYSSLHCLVVGGAPLDPAIVTGFTELGIIITNTYGTTEATGTVLAMPAQREAIIANPASCGIAAPLTEIRIVDRNDDDAASGATGEIWLRGPAISPGYWGMEQRGPGEWYKTGDAARINASGFYEIVDRWKDVYISGGENIYPAEVEIALRLHPGISDVAVIGIADEKWGEAGCAFVILAEGHSLSGDEIIQWCKTKIARYKAPQQVRFVDALPKNSSGKTRKDQLRHAHINTPA